MPFLNTDISHLLVAKFGFEETQSHHAFFVRTFPNQVRIRTKVSHGRHEIGRALESKMARQLHVTTECFRGMFSCNVSCEEYERIVACLPTRRP